MLGAVGEDSAGIVPVSAIRGILFDKDGTLLDFNRTWLPPYRRAAEYLQGRFGEDADADLLLAAGGFVAESQTWRADSPLASGCNREIMDAWAQAIGHPIDGDDRRAVAACFELPPDAWVPAVEGMTALLGALRRPGMRLGLATMDDQANAHQMLQAAGIEALFDFVCGADSGYGVKPETGMVLAFCRACGLRCDQVAMVGDSPKDLAMGRNAGVALTVGVLTGAHVAADLAPWADWVLDSIAGLEAVLDGNAGSASPG